MTPGVRAPAFPTFRPGSALHRADPGLPLAGLARERRDPPAVSPPQDDDHLRGAAAHHPHCGPRRVGQRGARGGGGRIRRLGPVPRGGFRGVHVRRFERVDEGLHPQGRPRSRRGPVGRGLGRDIRGGGSALPGCPHPDGGPRRLPAPPAPAVLLLLLARLSVAVHPGVRLHLLDPHRPERPARPTGQHRPRRPRPPLRGQRLGDGRFAQGPRRAVPRRQVAWRRGAHGSGVGGVPRRRRVGPRRGRPRCRLGQDRRDPRAARCLVGC